MRINTPCSFGLLLVTFCIPYSNAATPEHQHAARVWPNRKVVYYISSKFPSEPYHRIIKLFMKEISDKTCVEFVPRRSRQSDYLYIHISKTGECASPVGFVRGRQKFPITHGCALNHGIMIHELLHSTGLFHEQSRPDRDRYITVHYGEIRPDKVDNYYRYRPLMPYSWWKDIPYDYHSIMHYGLAVWTRRGLPVMTTRPAGKGMGSLGYMRDSDAAKVNKMYMCNRRRFDPPDMCYNIYNHCEDYEKKCENKNVRLLCRKTCHFCGSSSSLDVSDETSDEMSKLFRNIFNRFGNKAVKQA